MGSGGLKVLDIVALLADHPDQGLVRGQVGTIVENLEGQIFEVEFSGEDGVPYAVLPVPADQLIGLRMARSKAS